MTDDFKEGLDQVIYGLVYPGFLGSMLYELKPADVADLNLQYFIPTSGEIDIYIRYGILIFYFVDYFHLYGDLKAITKSPQNKDYIYFICDVVTCVGYLAAFIALSIPNYYWTICVFGAVPWLFLSYKRKNKFDRRYFPIYGASLALIPICCLVSSCFFGFADRVTNYLALAQVVLSLLFYSVYVFVLYSKKAKSYDKVTYP